MGCDFNETVNNWPCLLAEPTKHGQTLQSFRNGLCFEKDREELVMSSITMHTTRTSFGKLEKLGCYRKRLGTFVHVC